VCDLETLTSIMGWTVSLPPQKSYIEVLTPSMSKWVSIGDKIQWLS
jgi:hypothetical protein